MGIERGLKLIDGREDLAALLVFETDKGVEMIPSKRFAKYLCNENGSTKDTNKEEE